MQVYLHLQSSRGGSDELMTRLLGAHNRNPAEVLYLLQGFAVYKRTLDIHRSSGKRGSSCRAR